MEQLTTTATDWAAMRFEDRLGAIGERWRGFQRRTLVDAWDIGRGLRAVKDEMQHGEWMPFLAENGIESRTAQRFMALGEGIQIRQLVAFASVDEALKSLPPKPPKEEPAVEPKAEQPPVEPVTFDVMSEAEHDEAELTEEEAESAMEEAAAEHEEQRDHEAEREARDERLAHRLEAAPGEAVDALSGQLDKADARHRDDVHAVNEARRMAAASLRKCNDVRDALLAIPRGKEAAGVDDVLMRFFLVQRKS